MIFDRFLDDSALTPVPSSTYKRASSMALIFTSFAVVYGQGTINTNQYLSFSPKLYGATEVPPNASTNLGGGFFRLTVGSSLLSCRVWLDPEFQPTSAGVFGPASATSTGPLILDMGTPHIYTSVLTVVTWPEGPHSYTNIALIYTNTLTLTTQQVSQLKAGQWYVDVASAAYPAGELRGHILPEAPTLSNPTWASSGFRFDLITPANWPFTVEGSTDRVHWSALPVSQAGWGDGYRITDQTASAYPCRFYRVRLD